MASPALEDFARRPTAYKAGVFAGIFLLLLAVYYQFLYKSLGQSLEDETNSANQMRGQKSKMEKDEEAFRKLQAEMVDLKQKIDKNQKALPTGAELPAFFDTLNRKVNEAGVEIRKWEYKSDVPIASFVKVPVEIELTGTFFELKRFFASLVQRSVARSGAGASSEEERERIVTIENLQLSNPQVRDREILLTAKFTASTFRQDEAEAAGAPAPGAGGGRAPAATPQPPGGRGSLEGGL